MIGLLARWRSAAAGIGVVLLLVLAGWISHQRSELSAARLERDAARIEAAASTLRAEASRRAGETAARTSRRIEDVVAKTQETVDELEKAAGADAPLPDDVHDRWLAGLGQLRRADAAAADADDPAG